MAAQELFGRRVSGDSAELSYKITGTSDDGVARTELLAAAPTTLNSLERDDDTAEVEEVSTQLWIGRVRYKKPGTFRNPTINVGESLFSFDTSGGTQHIKAARSTIGAWNSGGPITSPFKGLIGVTRDGVEGVEVTSPVYTWEETHAIAQATVNDAYKGTLFALTGRFNDATFKGFDAGECLLLGARGTQRGDDDWEITFRFAGSPNRTNITVGSITVASKLGWDYLWVHYLPKDDAALGIQIWEPNIAVVDRVYEPGDFSLLGIGT